MRDLISKFLGHSLMSWLSFLLNFVIFFMVARKYGITGVGVIALYNLFSMNGLGGLLDLSLSTVIHRELTRANLNKRNLLLSVYIQFFFLLSLFLVSFVFLLNQMITLNEAVFWALLLMPTSLFFNLVKQKFYSESSFKTMGLFVILVDIARLSALSAAHDNDIHDLVFAYALPGHLYKLLISLIFLRRTFMLVSPKIMSSIMVQSFLMARFQIASRFVALATSQAERIIFSFVSLEALGAIEILTKIPNTIQRFTGIVSNIFITMFSKANLSLKEVRRDIRNSAIINTAGFTGASIIGILLAEEYFDLIAYEASSLVFASYIIMLISVTLLSFHFVFNLVLSYDVETDSIFRYKVLFAVAKISALLLCFNYFQPVAAVALAWIASSLAIVPFLGLYSRNKIFSAIQVTIMQLSILLTIGSSIVIYLIAIK